MSLVISLWLKSLAFIFMNFLSVWDLFYGNIWVKIRFNIQLELYQLVGMFKWLVKLKKMTIKLIKKTLCVINLGGKELLFYALGYLITLLWPLFYYLS